MGTNIGLGADNHSIRFITSRNIRIEYFFILILLNNIFDSTSLLSKHRTPQYEALQYEAPYYEVKIFAYWNSRKKDVSELG